MFVAENFFAGCGPWDVERTGRGSVGVWVRMGFLRDLSFSEAGRRSPRGLWMEGFDLWVEGLALSVEDHVPWGEDLVPYVEDLGLEEEDFDPLVEGLGLWVEDLGL